MKIQIVYIILFLLCFGCENKKEELTFKSTSFTEKTCETCPIIDINFPKALGGKKIDSSINEIIEKEIILILTFDDEKDIKTIKEAATLFTKEFKELQQKYPDESTNWEAKIKGKVSYKDTTMLSIDLDAYLFTGGAHGYNASRFLNINELTGQVVENDTLFTNTDTFLQFAETKFRAQEEIPAATAINSTGFMFTDNTFHLPENIGYTTKGLLLLYEQYEVSSFADGPIKLIIPFKEANKFLKFPAKP